MQWLRLSNSWDIRVKVTCHAWSLAGDRMVGHSLKWALGKRNVFGCRGIKGMDTATFYSSQVNVSKCEKSLGQWWGVHWYPTSGASVFRIRSWVWRAMSQRSSCFIWPLNACFQRSLTTEIYWECSNLTWSKCFSSTVSPSKISLETLRSTLRIDFFFPFSLGLKVEGKSQKLGGLSSLLFGCSKIPYDWVLDKNVFKLGLWRIFKPGETKLSFVQPEDTRQTQGESSLTHN